MCSGVTGKLPAWLVSGIRYTENSGGVLQMRLVVADSLQLAGMMLPTLLSLRGEMPNVYVFFSGGIRWRRSIHKEGKLWPVGITNCLR